MKEIAVSIEEQILEQYGFLKFPEIIVKVKLLISKWKVERMKDTKLWMWFRLHRFSNEFISLDTCAHWKSGSVGVFAYFAVPGLDGFASACRNVRIGWPFHVNVFAVTGSRAVLHRVPCRQVIGPILRKVVQLITWSVLLNQSIET